MKRALLKTEGEHGKNMAEKFYITGNYKTNHSEYGGKIYASDFDRKTTLAEIAAKITADQRFDRQCSANIKNRAEMGGQENAENNQRRI